MERKRAWITAGTIAVTFTTAVLAVMANTGLLSLARPPRHVGQLTPVDLLIQPTLVPTTPVPATSASSTIPKVVVRYEDVYLTIANSATTTPMPTAPTVPVNARDQSRVKTPKGPKTNVPTKTSLDHDGDHEDD